MVRDISFHAILILTTLEQCDVTIMMIAM